MGESILRALRIREQTIGILHRTEQEINRISAKVLDLVFVAEDIQLHHLFIVGKSLVVETLHQFRVIVSVLVGEILIVKPVDEKFECCWIIMRKSHRLGLRFVEIAIQSAAKEARVMRKQRLLHDEPRLVCSDDDSGILRFWRTGTACQRLCKAVEVSDLRESWAGAMCALLFGRHIDAEERQGRLGG